MLVLPARGQDTGAASTAAATDPAPQGGGAPTAPQPLPTPSMGGALSTAVPHTFDAGPFGKVAVTGILSGMGWTENNRIPIPGQSPTHWDVSNAQVFLQK